MNKPYYIDDICKIAPIEYTLFVTEIFCTSCEKFQTIMESFETAQRNYRRGFFSECDYELACSQIANSYM